MINYPKDINFWKKASPIRLYEQVLREGRHKVTEDEWKQICYEVQKAEGTL